MNKEQAGNVGHMRYVQQWLKSNPPAWDESHLPPDQENGGLATKLYGTCLEMLQSLCQPSPAQNPSQAHTHVLREELGKLFLWGESLRSGDLDKALAFADGLQEIVLKKFTEIGRLLLEFTSSPDFIEGCSPRPNKGLKTLLQQARSTVVRRRIDDDQGSDDNSSDYGSDEESRSTTYDFWQITKKLQTQTSHLARIGPTIRRSLARLEKEELKSKSIYPPVVPFQVSSAAGIYVSLIRDKFKDASDDLVEWLGEANWQRHQNVRNVSVVSDGATLHQPQPAEPASTAVFRPVSTFHDSGLGTSVPNESHYAPSHTSFLSSNTNGELGDLRVPTTPGEVQQGKPFECFLCQEILTSVRNRVDWKIHVYADLRPYICTFPGCKAELAQYSSRTEWGEHEFKHHRVTCTWRCPDCQVTCSNLTDYENHAKSSHGRQQATVAWQMTMDRALDKRENSAEHEQCPLCCSTPGGSRRAFVNHVARHMEQIALLALPRATEESDDEVERDGSESLADAISSSCRQGTTLKSGPLKDKNNRAGHVDEREKRSQSPHIKPPISPTGKFEAQARAPSQWLPEHDEFLTQARTKGLSWQSIASTYFPDKTANACRKRHERLLEKRAKALKENHFDSDAATVGSRGLLSLPDQAFPPLDEDSSKTANLLFGDIPRDENNENILGREVFRHASIPQASTVNANSQDVTTVRALYGCNVCGESLRNLEDLLVHEQAHSSESLKAYREPAVSSTKHAQTRRQGTMPEEAIHECRICGKLFKRSYNWKSHLETHNPERKYPHPCTAVVGNQPCTKKFRRKTDLDRHYDHVHLKLRAHQCNLCGNRFVRRDTLRRHTEDGCPKRFELGAHEDTGASSAKWSLADAPVGSHRSSMGIPRLSYAPMDPPKFQSDVSEAERFSRPSWSAAKSGKPALAPKTIEQLGTDKGPPYMDHTGPPYMEHTFLTNTM